MKRKKPNPYEKPRERYVGAPKYKRPKFSTLRPRAERFVYSEAELKTKNLPSLITNSPDPNLGTVRIVYEDEMKIREEAALVEKARRAKMLVPLYNKGPVQFIGLDPPKEIIEALGRKV